MKLLDIFRKKVPKPVTPDTPYPGMVPGTVKTFRLFNDEDRSKDRTLVVYAGQLDARKLCDVERVIAGHAWQGVVEIPIEFTYPQVPLECSECHQMTGGPA